MEGWTVYDKALWYGHELKKKIAQDCEGHEKKT